MNKKNISSVNRSGQLNDTMEFEKGKVRPKSIKKPVIEKVFSNETSANIKKKAELLFLLSS